MEPTIEQKIVEAILRDMTDRRGLSQEWEGIDNDIQEEIRKTWAGKVRAVLDAESWGPRPS